MKTNNEKTNNNPQNVGNTVKHDLGDGFDGDFITRAPDNLGNTIEVEVYFDNECIVDSGIDRKFGTVAEAVHYLIDTFIPKYIKEHDLKTSRYLNSDRIIDMIVNKIIINNKITYGYSIDIINELAVLEYAIPDYNDKMTVSDIENFYTSVNKINKRLLKWLKVFGFGADRDKSNIVDHTKIEKHPNCNNVIYTRYPWTAGMKAIKTVNKFIVDTDRDFLKGQEMNAFKTMQKTEYGNLIMVVSGLSKVHTGIVDLIKDNDFEKNADKFMGLIDKNKVKLVKKWSKLQPKNYGNFDSAWTKDNG